MNHDLAQAFFRATLLVATPVLLSSLIAGLVVGLLQAATQVNDAAVGFLPKVFVGGLACLLIGPWMLEQFVFLVRDAFQKIGAGP